MIVSDRVDKSQGQFQSMPKESRTVARSREVDDE